MAACFSAAPDSRPTFERLNSGLTPMLMQQIEATATLPTSHLCPISLERMTDPVKCSDGFTYDRVCIDSWLRSSDLSPATNAPLPNRTLTPDLALRAEISRQPPPPSARK